MNILENRERQVRFNHAFQVKLHDGIRCNVMARMRSEKQWRIIACVVLVVAMAFQNIAIFQGDSVAGLKPYHVILIALLVFTLANREGRWRLPSLLFTFAVLALCLISIADYITFGSSNVMYNYIVLLLVIAVFINLGSSFSEADWGHVVRVSSTLIMLAVLLNLLLQTEEILRYFDNRSYHPELSTLFGGGVNLEATWLAIFGVFYTRNLKGILYLSSSLFVSLLYLSRVGIVLSLIAAVYVFLWRPDKSSFGVKALLLALFSLFALLVLMDMDSFVLDRFLSAGNDNGTRGRMMIWQYFGDAFFGAPLFGYGAGNAMDAITSISLTEFNEDNVHNYYAQVLLDFGLIGVVLFGLLLVAFVRIVIRDGLTPSNVAIILYLLAAFIQFRGAESMLGFFLALLFCASFPMKGERGSRIHSRKELTPIASSYDKTLQRIP